MSANVEGMVREGINAFKAGRKDEARALLSKAVELDPYNEEGWLWLSGVVVSAEDQRTCLENVLAINPSNGRARSGLDYLNSQNPAPAAPPAPPAEPATVVQSAAPPPVPVPPAPVAATLDTSTSVEWATAGTEDEFDEGWHSPDPAATESYDEWVTGLQLGGVQAAPMVRHDPFASPTGNASPFFADDVSTDDEGELDFDLSGTDFEPTPYAVPAAAEAQPASVLYTLPPAQDNDVESEPVNAPAAQAVATPAAVSAAALADLTIDDEVVLTQEELSLFPDIPREIKATRLPGTHERGPLLLKIAVALLAAANIVVAALFFWQVL